MKYISRQTQANSTASRWRCQYSGRIGMQGDDKDFVYQELMRLGSSPKPESIEKIVGNTSWTSIQCSECKKDVQRVIQLGDEPDYESNTALVCEYCLKEALQLIGSNLE